MQHNKKLTSTAQRLRREMTKEEKQLWYQYLRKYPIQFRRQVTCGRFILDFYCAKAKLAVEIDGSQHYLPDGIEKDAARTAYLHSLGIEVLRIPNNAIWNNLRGVCEQIDLLVGERTVLASSVSPSDCHLPQGGR